MPTDLEVRILEQTDKGYPIEITLDDRQEFPRGYLQPDDILPWLASDSQAMDGQRLFQALLADGALHQAWAEARGQYPERRIRLRIDETAPELHPLPWELLQDPSLPTPIPLAASTATPFSRYLAGQWVPGQTVGKQGLKLLLVIANPEGLEDFGLSEVDVTAEWATMQAVLAEFDIAVTVLGLDKPATLPALEAELQQGYHILHFIGHGRYMERGGRTMLYLGDEDNFVDPVTSARLGHMLARNFTQSETGAARLRLIFLSACQSASQSPADAFRGLAPRLITAGVPAVVAMQDLVPVQTARDFARSFYQRLLAHGQVDMACNEARSALISANIAGSAIPVLFSRLLNNQLFDTTLVEETHTPFMVDDLPLDFVFRANEFNSLRQALLKTEDAEASAKTGRNPALTVALCGAGGYGKSTLAQSMAHDEEIRRLYKDGVLWITLGENPGDLTNYVEDLIYTLSGERFDFGSLDTAVAQFVKLLAQQSILLILDDVWNQAHLRPFMQGGPACIRLITTRDRSVLPPTTQIVDLVAMAQEEAVQLLSAGLNLENPEPSLAALSTRLGEWPLLLKLANGILRHRINDKGQNIHNALSYVNKALDKRGLSAFDQRSAEARDQAVTKTLGVSLELLREDELARYQELAIFPEDAQIPLATLEKLWGTTGGLDDFDTEELCDRLYQLSLLLNFDPKNHLIRLHDIIRTYLAYQQRERLPELHHQFLQTYPVQDEAWANLASDEPYLWDNLAYHLLAANRKDEFLNTVQNLDYIVAKILARNARAVEQDLLKAEKLTPNAVLSLLRRSLANDGYLLKACKSRDDLSASLLSRIQHHRALVPLIRNFKKTLKTPYLTPWQPFPDLPSPALLRTLSGHRGPVMACAMTVEGRLAISASTDNSLILWDVQQGLALAELTGHENTVRHCAISGNGQYAVSVAEDRTLRLWNTQQYRQVRVLETFAERALCCALSVDGLLAVAGLENNTAVVWDIKEDKALFTLTGHQNRILDCCISSDKTLIVTASDDKTLKIWSAQTGQECFSLRGHTDSVWSCALNGDNSVLVSASQDQTLKVWDLSETEGTERLTLQGHADRVWRCAISFDAEMIVSASDDRMVKVWDAFTGKETMNLGGHTFPVTSCAMNADGSLIISASADRTLKVWDVLSAKEDIKQRRVRRGRQRRATRKQPLQQSANDTNKGTKQFVMQNNRTRINSCAVSGDGTTVTYVAWDRTLRILDSFTGFERNVLEGHQAWVNSCAVNHSGTQIISASRDKTLVVWNTRTGQKELVLTGHQAAVTDCAISRDDSIIVSASADRSLKVWSAETGAETATLMGHTDKVLACAVSKNGQAVVSVAEDGLLKVWDLASQSVKRTFSGPGDVLTECDISQDGQLLLSCSADKTIKLWAVNNADDQPKFTLSDHTDKVLDCAFSPKPKYIASVSQDSTIKIWDTETGVCLTTLALSAPVHNCAWFPDNRHLLAVGDGGIYFLRLKV